MLLVLLAQFGDDGRALAGGHSLIPMMKLRLATPATSSILRESPSSRVCAEGDEVVIGAMTTSTR